MSNLLITLSINIVILSVFFIFFKRRIDRSLSTTEILDSVRDEVQHLIVELNQTSDRNVGLIEDKIARLQKLLDEADRKIVVLNRELDKHNVTTNLYDHLRKSAAVEMQVRKEPEPKPAIEEFAASEDTKSRLNVQEILGLHRQGFAASIIATKFGSSIGEVELIISLGEKK
jgi:hypothetical protein